MNSYDTLLDDMGKRIFELRNRMNLTQEDFAELADVSPQMVSTAERGEKALRPENLLKISKALGVSVDYLLTGEIIEKDATLIANKLMSLTPGQLHTIDTIIDNCISLCDKHK